MSPRSRSDEKNDQSDRNSETASCQSEPPKSGTAANRAIRDYFASPSRIQDGGSLPGLQTEDWRFKPELPTSEEILGLGDEGQSDVMLLPNVIAGPWPSTELYLNAHYNLIREDAIATLRDAVLYVRTYPRMHDNGSLCVYEKVFMLQATLANRGVAFRFQFSTRRADKRIPWKYSSRLMCDGIVALSPAKDCFSTKCVVGVVAARPLVHLEKNPPEVDICFADAKDIEFDPQQEWIMVQARSGYYEAHRHTLTALQKLSREQFPLKQNICNLQPDIGVPEHVLANPVMDFQVLYPATAAMQRKTTFNVLHDFPAAPMAGLNPHQWQALEQMLTRKLSIVQGPPGTGKTHVSVIFLKLLLSQMTPNDPPIIIAAHTNHALDQLLNLVSRFEQNYIRLGRRCGDPEIQNRVLFEIRKSKQMPTLSGGLFGPTKNDLHRLQAQIVALLAPFDKENIQGPITASTFAEYGLLTPNQCDSIKAIQQWVSSATTNDTNNLAVWLGDRVKDFQPPCWISEDCSDEEYEELKELEAEQGPMDDEWDTLRGRTLQFRTTYQGTEGSSFSKEEIQRYLSTDDLMKIPPNVRGAVYNYLRRELLDLVNAKLRPLVKSYDLCTKRIKIGRWEHDFEILRKTKLVAMTTTGLSKYRGLVASLNPRIVMIEEAAEVLEAPIAVACFETIQQLILVGDHLQLKAKSTLQDLAGEPFFLETSMFERLVRNSLPYVQLREQRRMAPEIRELLMPIYGDLYDHPSVARSPLVPGMGYVRSFFFTHDWPESGDSLASKLNELEAIMIVEFYVYLLLNGNSTFDMTIMTFYNGQRKLILKHTKKHPFLVGHLPKVATVDSYQGEENEIVLLSLVRSNKTDGIGFLSDENRTCVAMSRAKRGFYIFGNSNTLGEYSPLWKSIISILENPDDESRIGNRLPLTCIKHKNRTIIRELRDWEAIKGGCKQVCGDMLDCGHKCTLLCHGFSHNWSSCSKPCTHVQTCCGAHCTEICGSTHQHRCDCATQLNARSMLEEFSPEILAGTLEINDLYSGLYDIDPATRRKIIATEKEVHAKRMRNDSPAEPLIDTTIPASESHMMKVGLWGTFANNSGASIPGATDTFNSPGVRSEDVQEGLEKATEKFIQLTTRKSKKGSGASSADSSSSSSSVSPRTSPLIEAAAKPVIDLIEFD